MSGPESAVNPLRFCAVVTNQHALGGDLTAQIDGELSIADAARDFGWDGVAVTQHFLTGAWLHGIDQVAMLGRLIDRTGDMSLVVSINLLALHNPVATAEQFASIDVLSGGRLVFGAGLGYRDEEYLAFGIDRKSMVERFEGNSRRSRSCGRATSRWSISRGVKCRAPRSPPGPSRSHGPPS